ncbi:hypothetical protein EVAR_20983_1 [Eumeta japonica]|uniref:Uncharacterized protein n=1 Tax=Eumeta variegata TaxID=151549 RepID=A0A4C1V6H5_EUMVA|nr:hypothetical protein EVAR_20983_1 [Eumeta japonica]
MPGVAAPEGQRLCEYPEKYRMKLEPDENTVSRWTQHRALFLQHMLSSHMYTNSSIHQPWNMVGRISDKIIDDALIKCARELQIQDKVLQMYQAETC